MLKILWVEDEYSEQKQIAWFNNRSVCVKTSFDEGDEAIDSCLTQFDLIVLDINLENSEHTDKVKELAKQFKITGQEFLQESGMNLFLNLLEHGFPKEQIIFLTANADINISRIDEFREAYSQGNDDVSNEILGTITNGFGEETVKKCSEFIETEDIEGLCQYLENYFLDGVTNNTYNRFCEAYRRCRIEPPKAINKSLNEAKQHLNDWLEEHEKNDYLVLRRGIIEGCDFLKSHIENDDGNIQFRDFIKTDKDTNRPVIEIEYTNIKNYLDTLSQFLAIKQPNIKAIIDVYRLFLRTLVHEWEENIEPNKKYKYNDIYTFAWLSKMTRNWTSHANLLEPLNPHILAFLFMTNMRAMFRIPRETQFYEEILLSRISISKEIDDSLENKIEDIENNVNKILVALKIPKYKKDKYGNKIFDRNGKEKMKHFGDKINAIHQKNTGKPKQHDFNSFLLQYFWVNQKSSLDNLTANSDDFLPALARHIYNCSFYRMITP
jgi:CheY-like chemotaxis protein